MTHDMITLTIDGKSIDVTAGSTVLQACEIAGIEIPRFCYHERLSIAGNCRMCLVEVDKNPKPVASCALPAMADMVVQTKSSVVKAARAGVMEFLLINHPLDCPICDQGGECDLQDQALGYGGDASRFSDNKRAVEEKNMGPFIKTVMTRCIHCTRCIRFASEVAGMPELGALGRGEDMEVTTYLETAIESELSGNVIDLCPVGALTSRPFAFTARPWELRKTESIDVMDAVGSNIRIDTRGREVMRILPRNHDAINEEWISDKARFVADGLNCQRLDRPYIRRGGALMPTDWTTAFAEVAKSLPRDREKIGAIAGDLVCAEGQFAFRELITALGSPNIDCRQDGAEHKVGRGRESYLFNTTFAGIERADAILLIGCNLRFEAPVLNARIRKRWLATGRDSVPLSVGAIGAPLELTYPTHFLGADANALTGLLDRRGFYRTLARAKNPMVIIGQGALVRSDGGAVFDAALILAHMVGAVRKDWCGFNVLHIAAARVAGLDLGLVPRAGGLDTTRMLAAADKGKIKTMFLFGADEIDMTALTSCFTIYIGAHGDAGAHAANVVLPSAAFSEKQAIYVNSEGRAQMTARAAFPPGEAREDWKIFRALSSVLEVPLSYVSVDQLRKAMFECAPNLAQLDTIIAPDNYVEALPRPKRHGRFIKKEFTYPLEDYFMTNPCARASVTLARATESRKSADSKDKDAS